MILFTSRHHPKSSDCQLPRSAPYSPHPHVSDAGSLRRPHVQRQRVCLFRPSCSWEPPLIVKTQDQQRLGGGKRVQTRAPPGGPAEEIASTVEPRSCVPMWRPVGRRSAGWPADLPPRQPRRLSIQFWVKIENTSLPAQLAPHPAAPHPGCIGCACAAGTKSDPWR